jgi:tol-pal system protein YbgF
MRALIIASFLALWLPGYQIFGQEDTQERVASDFVIGLNAFNQQILSALDKQPTKRVIVAPFTDLQGKFGKTSLFITEQLITAIASTRNFQLVDSGPLADIIKEAGASALDLPTLEQYGGSASQFAHTSIVVGTVTDLGTRVAVMGRILEGQSGKIAGAAQVYLALSEELEALVNADRGQVVYKPRRTEKTGEELPPDEELPPGEELTEETTEPSVREDAKPVERPSTIPTVRPAGTTSPEENNDNAYYRAGRDSYEAGRYDEAQGHFERLLANFPDSPLADNAVYWIGECYYRRKEWSLALANFQRVTRDFPFGNKVPSAMLKIAYTQEQLGQLDAAIKTLEELIDRYSDSEEAERGRSKLQLLRAAKQQS